MAINFSNCEVSVGGNKIMAQNATISKNNSLSPIKVIGYSNPLNSAVPTDSFKNTVKINYLVEPGNEPNYNLSQSLIYYTNINPLELKIAGYTMTGYLNNYSINIDEHSPVKASAEYLVYHEIKGNLSEQSPTGYSAYNLYNSSGIAHYWTTQSTNIYTEPNGQLINLTYNFKADWKPIYRINSGSNNLSEVVFLGSNESFNFTSEYEPSVSYSGELTQDVLSDCIIIQLSNLSSLWTTDNSDTMYLYPYDGKVTSNEISISENNIITTQTEVIKYN